MKLEDLEIYCLSKEIAQGAWEIYEQLSWQDKKIMGDQFISAMDSIGANIAEGFGRYHYLDKNKFNYNCRGSLLESIHWLDTLFARKKVQKEKYDLLPCSLKSLHHKLNNYIHTTYGQTKKPE